MVNDLLKIDNTKIPNLVSYKVIRNKLWADATRNMNGDVRARLIGIFPKIEIKIGYCTEDEIATITSLLDQAYFTVSWYEPKTKTVTSARYYASDYSVEIYSKNKCLYAPFTVSLVPVSKKY